MKVVYFGFYNPVYSRNRVIIKGLKEKGVEVIECRSRHRGLVGTVNLFLKRLFLGVSYDAVIVGFPGQEVVFLAKILFRKPIIFDAFTSHYGGYILDKKYFSKRSFRAKYYRFLDRWSCKLADLVLLDTRAHIDFFVREFNLPEGKFRRIFVGADSGIFYPRKNRNADSSKYPFLVNFHGHYIPLQGVKYIIEAAKLLEKENVCFNLIGRGQTFKEDKELAEKLGLKNVNFIDSVPYDKLPDYMAQADVCLGIFGNSPKTDLVIPNKVYEALAMAKPVITADTPAAHELLAGGTNVFLCQKTNSKSLAETILFVRDNPDLAEKAAKSGYRLFKEKLKENVLAAELLKYIHEKIALRK